MCYRTGMYVKVTKSGPRKYVKLVEAFRDQSGKAKHRTVANLGRLETVEAGSVTSLINGLLSVTGNPSLDEGTGEVDFSSARSVGDTWLLTSLWKDLGFADGFRRIFDVEKLRRVMVFNRLCDPESKQGILRWMEQALVPDSEEASVTHQHLLRTMDTLCEGSEVLEQMMAKILRPLIDQALAIVFYDLTTIRTEGETDMPDESRKEGLSKEGGIGRQVMLV